MSSHCSFVLLRIYSLGYLVKQNAFLVFGEKYLYPTKMIIIATQNLKAQYSSKTRFQFQKEEGPFGSGGSKNLLQDVQKLLLPLQADR